jgi:hypothetical protein
MNWKTRIGRDVRPLYWERLKTCDLKRMQPVIWWRRCSTDEYILRWFLNQFNCHCSSIMERGKDQLKKGKKKVSVSYETGDDSDPISYTHNISYQIRFLMRFYFPWEEKDLLIFLNHCKIIPWKEYKRHTEERLRKDVFLIHLREFLILSSEYFSQFKEKLTVIRASRRDKIMSSCRTFFMISLTQRLICCYFESLLFVRGSIIMPVNSRSDNESVFKRKGSSN